MKFAPYLLVSALCIAGITGTTVHLSNAAAPVVAVKASTAPVVIALHKAIYDFRMTSAEASAGISGINGKMYYEQDENCDAWTTDHRFRVQYQYPERKPVDSTSHYVGFEAKNGNEFYFTSEREEDGSTAEQIRGTVAQHNDGTASADYARPENLSYPLPKGYLLPTQHTMEIIRRARAGEKVFNAVMFDGTDEDGPVEINTVIGKKLSAEEIKLIASSNDKIDASLLSPDAWHLRMAMFPLKDKQEMMPAYEMDVVLHDNGVVSYSLVDYKNFKVQQKLLALSHISSKPCKTDAKQ